MEQTLACAPAIRIFERLLRGFDAPPALRLWNDAMHVPNGAPAVFTLVLRDPGLLRRLVIERNPVLLADAYFRGALDVEGDLYSALQLKGHFESISLSWRDKLALLRDALRLPGPHESGFRPAGKIASRLARRFSHRHSRDSDGAAIAFHYDVSNAFYGLWLDQERVYSCAYFESANDFLDQAQRNKLEHICRKLRLQPGERLLDIGCGWGALVCWAARHHGVHAHGITLSGQQLAYAQQRIRAEGLEGLVTVELRDYRDLPTDVVYDKVASVGMFEHVGLANLPTYLATVQRVLRPGGLFLNHGITHDEEGWNRTVAAEFINRYVFPDAAALVLDRVAATVRHFPDGESHVRVDGAVQGRHALIVCTLDRPDAKLVPLFLLAHALRERGALSVGLVAPYLPYMRQDRQFHPGETVSALHVSGWIARHLDWLVTVDPHLHRITDLAQVYPIPTRVVHAAPDVAAWVRANVRQPLLVGPDEESAQWVREVARGAEAPFVVLAKERRGDRDVVVSVPDVDRWRSHTPVLVDDIVSTARTMIETVGHLRRAGLAAPVCVAVHAIFAQSAFEDLHAAGAADIVSCDTIVHPSNRIALATAIGAGVREMLATLRSQPGAI